MGTGTRRTALTAALALLLTGAGGAVAAPRGPAGPGTVGVDVSRPQSDRVFTAGQGAAFAVVGVNGRTFAEPNPAFAAQWQWASSLRGAPQLYVVGANPGPGGTFWGKGGPKPCDGGNSGACAYDYGWKGAEHAWAVARAGGLAAGQKVQWWIDVEEDSTWNRRTPASNAAVLRGIRDYLAPRALSVGVYTLDAAWTSLVGPAAGDLATLPVWAVGAPGPTAAAARARCLKPSAVRGPVVMAQSPARTGGISLDTVCPIRAVRSAPISRTGRATVTGTALPGTVVRLAVVQEGRPTRSLAVATDRRGRWSVTVTKLRPRVPAKVALSRSAVRVALTVR